VEFAYIDDLPEESPQERINFARRKTRMQPLRTTVYEFGPYRLDPAGRTLQRLGEGIALPPKAVEVLLELVKRPGAVAGKQHLMEAVWPEVHVEEANLNQMVFLLRRALGDGYITTVPRRGYRFAGDVRATEVPCGIESIAVLPLDNLSGDPAQDYFADGITEAIIGEMAKLSGLRVVSRTSVMRYRRTTQTIAQIARALRVQAVVEGSVMQSGEQLRITTQLIHAATDQHLWSKVHDGVIGEIFRCRTRSLAKPPRPCEEISAPRSRPGSPRRAWFSPSLIRSTSRGGFSPGNRHSMANRKRSIFSESRSRPTRTTRRRMRDWRSASFRWRIFSEWSQERPLPKPSRRRCDRWSSTGRSPRATPY
jgi:TolB-like protein